MVQDPVCEVCKSRHHPRQSHRFATNAAPAATNRVVSATNKGPSATNKKAVSRTPNRRDRDSYNAYQRDYMRRKRAG
jgi:hypothetical protein